MHKPRVYIDTSVIGGCFDEEFAEWSNKLFDDVFAGRIIAVFSEITIKELDDAPDHVKNKFLSIPPEHQELLKVSKEADDLARQYIESNAVPIRFIDDALHIAYASVNNIDILASWNFKHIVNIDRIKKYNSVNILMGYKPIEIRNPREVISNED